MALFSPNATTSTTSVISPGNTGCRCINETSTLASLSDRTCSLPDGENSGILLKLGTCSSYTYGSSECLQHDFLHDPICQTNGHNVIPSYCFRPWCYVDASSCSRNSEEIIYRSSYFSESDIFYSYTTCNSTADDWLAAEGDVLAGQKNPLGKIPLKVAMPYYIVPMVYKRNTTTDAVKTHPGEEYFDNSVPYEGVYLNYMRDIKTISEGDIQSLTYTHRSRGSSTIHPHSAYTATVQDVANGLVDMAVGPFWITGERLQLTAFTIPIVTDKTYLVIPRPTDEGLNDQIVKVLAPFTNQLWGLILGIICLAALLSVWFTDRHISKPTSDKRKKFYQQKNVTKRRKSAYARLALDSFLSMGSHFVSSSVDFDEGASLPQKFLMFGFGFFILITVSAYVANLAAFLTMSLAVSVSTVEEAVAAGYKVCAHPVLRDEILAAWPDGDFYFSQRGTDFWGMLDDYDEGLCQVLVIGWEDTHMDSEFIGALCKRDLVYTDSAIAEIPMGFPIRSDLAPSFSYWIYDGWKNHDLSIEKAKEDFVIDLNAGCSIKLSSGDATGASTHAQIGIQNMFFPLLFFGTFALIATCLQVLYVYQVKKGSKGSLVGRISTMNLVSTQTNKKKVKQSRAFTKRSSKLDDTEDPFRRHRVVSLNREEEEEKLEEVEEEVEDVEEAVKFGDVEQSHSLYGNGTLSKRSAASIEQQGSTGD